MEDSTIHNRLLVPSRRHLLQMMGAGAAVSALPFKPALAARPIRIGFVSPTTGPLAAFAESDDFVLAQVREATKNGIEINGTRYAVEIIHKDSQSNPNRAAEVAGELILSSQIDLMVAGNTPETVNPVADQCEANEIPCITNDCPWQPYFFGRGGRPGTGFEWTYHFFWGLEDVIAVYTDLWDLIPTNKVVGALWPNDSDGNAWSDPDKGFPGVLKAKGYKLVDPGRFHSFTDDFTAQINAFKAAGVEIVTGVVVPPDFTTFWTQAAQQGFHPKVATVGKALEFPGPVAALGKRAENTSVEVWWSPNHPFSSSMTGQSSKALAEAYMAASNHPWTMPLAFRHSLFEVALDVLRRTKSIEHKDIRDAIAATQLNTIVGPVNWKTGPVKNVSKTPLVGGQWQPAAKGGLELAITSNKQAPNIPLGGQMRPLA
jgi:branched-chain amino acid transport system substrate-binding protein